jgi:hypothetical protein
MPLPTHEERAGERVFRELPDRKSSGDQYRSEAVQKSGDVNDALNNLSNIVQEGVGVTRPTGQHALPPRGGYHAPNQPGPAAPDLVVGVAAGAAMIAEMFRAARKRSKGRKGKSGND